MPKVGFVPLAEFRDLSFLQVDIREADGETRTWDIAKALRAGKGKIVTEDPLEQQVLDNREEFKRGNTAVTPTPKKKAAAKPAAKQATTSTTTAAPAAGADNANAGGES